MVGLAAYLRQLGESRTRQIDEIEEGKVWNYPLTEMHTTEKLKHLRRSRDRLNQVAPGAIWFTIGIGIRLWFSAYAKYKFPYDEQHYGDAFRFVDLIILTGFVVLLLALYYMHAKTRSGEVRIRAMMEVWKEQRTKKQQDQDI